MAYFKLEPLPLLQGQAIALCNNRYNVNNFAQFFHHNHVNWPQSVTSRVDKIQAAMDTRILDVSVTHGRKFFAQICAVLVFNIFNNGIPAINSYSELGIFLINTGKLGRTTLRC